MIYKELDDASYTDLRKNLIKKKGSEEQKNFLRIVLSSKDFCKWIREQVKTTTIDDELPILNYKMTESEFKDPPKSTEQQVYDSWKILSPADASRSTIWAFTILRQIESGKIESSFLAANGGSLSGGRERIDRALKTSDDKQIDSAVRTVLRRMGGLPEARGNKSIYVNCPLARAWWRGYMANEVCEQSPLSTKENVIKVLKISQQYWENLITLVVSRNSVLGDSRVRTALISVLSELIDREDKQTLFEPKTLQQIQYVIGIRSAWQELGVFTVEELQKIIKEEIFQEIT